MKEAEKNPLAGLFYTRNRRPKASASNKTFFSSAAGLEIVFLVVVTVLRIILLVLFVVLIVLIVLAVVAACAVVAFVVVIIIILRHDEIPPDCY